MLLLLFIPMFAASQTETAHLYHPDADAKADVNAAVKKAATENKHVILMIGGNWCRWCIMFDKFQHANAPVDSAIKANYIFQHINHSKENRNASLLAELEYPQRFGFPVFIVLNQKGERIHTQNSVYLEQGEGYSVEKVVEFLDQWSPNALKPDNYNKK